MTTDVCAGGGRRLPGGGILIFLTGRREIDWMVRKLSEDLNVKRRRGRNPATAAKARHNNQSLKRESAAPAPSGAVASGSGLSVASVAGKEEAMDGFRFGDDDAADSGNEQALHSHAPVDATSATTSQDPDVAGDDDGGEESEEHDQIGEEKENLHDDELEDASDDEQGEVDDVDEVRSITRVSLSMTLLDGLIGTHCWMAVLDGLVLT